MFLNGGSDGKGGEEGGEARGEMTTQERGGHGGLHMINQGVMGRAREEIVKKRTTTTTTTITITITIILIQSPDESLH